MDHCLSQKIHVGISACQFGCKVRYNAKGWDMVENLHREKAEFVWHPVCPEVMSGMGIPRTPISLQGGNGDDFWQNQAHIKDRHHQKWSAQIREGCHVCLQMLHKAGVDVFIFMEGSPTCGIYRTTLRNQRLGKPPGIFGSLLLREKMFLIPAVDLQSPIKWWDWRRRMYAFVWVKQQEIATKANLYEVWHTVKFLCQELFRQKSNALGHRLATLSEFHSDIIEEIRTEILDILRHPSDIAKIKQSLWKNYAYLRKKKHVFVDEVMEPTNIRNMRHIANELIKVEIVSRDQNVLFGASPIYRDISSDH